MYWRKDEPLGGKQEALRVEINPVHNEAMDKLFWAQNEDGKTWAKHYDRDDVGRYASLVVDLHGVIENLSQLLSDFDPESKREAAFAEEEDDSEEENELDEEEVRQPRVFCKTPAHHAELEALKKQPLNRELLTDLNKCIAWLGF